MLVDVAGFPLPPAIHKIQFQSIAKALFINKPVLILVQLIPSELVAKSLLVQPTAITKFSLTREPYPRGPIAPVGPVDPDEPVNPVGPVNPVEPVGPVNPVGPVAPVAPEEPVNPIGPVKPVTPIEPVKPVAPIAKTLIEVTILVNPPPGNVLPQYPPIVL